jgi:hypothetical protein
MRRLWEAVKRWLVICGGFSLLVVVVLVGYLAYEWTYGNRERSDDASARDVRFVLNWADLGEDRIERVVHSYRSPRSLGGGHIDAYAILVSRLEAPSWRTRSPRRPI